MKLRMARSFTAMALPMLVALSILLLIECVRGQVALEITQWRLTEWTLSSLRPDAFDITATFADGQVFGHRVESGRLTLFDAGGNESLIFEAATRSHRGCSRGRGRDAGVVSS
jgi:hypothetical protein